MEKLQEIFHELAELEQIDIDTKIKRKRLYLLLANLPTTELPELSLPIPTFQKNVDAYKYVLEKYPDGLHVRDLSAELLLLGIDVPVNTISGVLRSYDRKGLDFVALGGNRFKLRNSEDKSK